MRYVSWRQEGAMRGTDALNPAACAYWIAPTLVERGVPPALGSGVRAPERSLGAFRLAIT